MDKILSSHRGAVRGSVHAVAAVGDAPKNGSGAAQRNAEFVPPGKSPVAVLIPSLEIVRECYHQHSRVNSEVRFPLVARPYTRMRG